MISPERRPTTRQDQQAISLDTASIHDPLLDIGIRLEQWNTAPPISGQTHAHQFGPVFGLLLPGACPDQHKIRPGAVEGGA